MADAAAPWRWCVRFYRRPGVASACLALQDRHGADVCLLLALLWAGTERRAVDVGALARLLTISRRWQGEVIGPLRAARRALKHPKFGTAALRQRVAAAELMAERAEITQLAAALPAPRRSAADPAALVARNLAVYQQRIDRAQSADARARLTVLHAAAIKDVEKRRGPS